MEIRHISLLCLRDGAALFGGLLCAEGRALEIDIYASQLPECQARIDAGDITVNGMSATPAVEKPKSK